MFYKTFKIGIEIEGEFFKKPSLNYWEVGSDNSIVLKNSNNFANELRSIVISNEKEEEVVFKDLSNLKEEKTSFGKKIFSVKNNSCGTHIHFSFQSEKNDNDLYIFDTIEFERYFMKRYNSFFKNTKFVKRIFNEYCKPFSDLEKGERQYRVLNIEKKKANRDKYVWLNSRTIHDGTGFEIRIFPHVQTVVGIKQIVEFTKSILLSYFNLKKTQQDLEYIRLYFKNYNSRLNYDKLSINKRIIYDSMPTMSRNNCTSGDAMIIMGKWMKQSPKIMEEPRRNRIIHEAPSISSDLLRQYAYNTFSSPVRTFD